MAIYPSTLPGPERLVHTPKLRVNTPMLPGPGAYDNRELDYSGVQDLEFFFTAEQTAIFYAWWRDSLSEGGRWFNASWPALRAGASVIQFISEPAFTHVYNGAHRVSVTAQVRGAAIPVVSCKGDPYYFGETNDPYYGYVVLQCNFATNYDDTSQYRHAPTVTAPAAVTSLVPGTVGGSLDLTGGGQVAFPDNPAFALGTAFCIEFVVQMPPSGTGGFTKFTIVDQYAGSPLSNSSFHCYREGAAFKMRFTQSGTERIISSGELPQYDNQLVHVAFMSTGGGAQIVCSVAGIVRATLSGSAIAVANSTLPVRVGNFTPDATFGTNGRIQLLRITNGHPRYSSGFFTPPSKVYPTKVETPNVAYSLEQSTANAGITVSAPTVMTHRVVATAGATSSYYNGKMRTIDFAGLKYAEFKIEGSGDSGNNTGRGCIIGFCLASGTLTTNPFSDPRTGVMVSNLNYNGGSPGYMVNGGAAVANNAYDFVQNDVVSMAYDLGSGNVWVRKNGGAWIGGGDPVAKTSPTFTITIGPCVPTVVTYHRGTGFTGDYRVRVLVDGDTFTYPLPTGYSAWRGTWLPRKTIARLHCDSVIDSSISPKIFVLEGSAAIVDNAGAFNGALSITNPGGSSTNGAYLGLGHDGLFGTEDWAVEMLVKRTSHAYIGCMLYMASPFVLLSALASTGQIQWSIGVTGGLSITTRTPAAYIPLNTYARVAIQRKAGVIEVYLDRVLVDSAPLPGGATDTINWSVLYIGKNVAAGTHSWNGFIDEFWMLRGVSPFYTGYPDVTLPYCEGIWDA